MLYIVLLYHTIFYYSVFYYNSLNTAIIYSITIHLQLFTYIPIYIYILFGTYYLHYWMILPRRRTGAIARPMAIMVVLQDGGEYIAQILMFHRHQICWRDSFLDEKKGTSYWGKKLWRKNQAWEKSRRIKVLWL